jgi:hypothetical protein
MKDLNTTLLLKEIVELLATVTEEVALLLEEVKPSQHGKRPLSPDARAHDIRQKIAVVRAALARVQ